MIFCGETSGSVPYCGIKAKHREVTERGETHVLREPGAAYEPVFSGENDPLREINMVPWEKNLEPIGT